MDTTEKVFDIITNYIKTVQTQFGKVVKILITDNGTEFKVTDSRICFFLLGFCTKCLVSTHHSRMVLLRGDIEHYLIQQEH